MKPVLIKDIMSPFLGDKTLTGVTLFIPTLQVGVSVFSGNLYLMREMKNITDVDANAL